MSKYIVSHSASLPHASLDDTPQSKANEKAKDHGPLPKNELALGAVLDPVPGDRGTGKAVWTEKQPSVALDGEGGQVSDGASSNESTPAKRNFLGWKWQVSRPIGSSVLATAIGYGRG